MSILPIPTLPITRRPTPLLDLNELACSRRLGGCEHADSKDLVSKDLTGIQPRPLSYSTYSASDDDALLRPPPCLFSSLGKEVGSSSKLWIQHHWSRQHLDSPPVAGIQIRRNRHDRCWNSPWYLRCRPTFEGVWNLSKQGKVVEQSKIIQ